MKQLKTLLTNILQTMSNGLEMLSQDDKIEVYKHDNRDLIDIQVSTAHAYPRKITKVIENCVLAISQSKEVAESCIYTLPKSGSPTGPSIHLARIIMQNYGNLRVESKVVETQLKIVVAESIAWDLESNLAVKIQTQRSIFGKDGRFSNDMIVVTSNAAVAIALRNSVFNIIPREYLDQLVSTAKRVILGDVSDKVKFAAKRKLVVQGFKDVYGLTEKEILSFVKKQAVENLDEDDVLNLIAVGNVIKAGETTIDEVFRPKKNAFTESDNEEENRLMILIKESTSIPELEKHQKHIKTVDQRIAYDERYKTLSGTNLK